MPPEAAATDECLAAGGGQGGGGVGDARGSSPWEEVGLGLGARVRDSATL